MVHQDKTRPNRETPITNNLPRWGVKAIYRLAQKMNKPGIYPVALILTEDGRRQLVIEGKVEELGR